MIAEVIIDELTVKAIIGCNPSERLTPQVVQISLALKYDISKPSLSDDVNDAINYSDICRKIKLHVENSSFNLLESLAESIINIVFEYSKVIQVSLFIYKPNAIKYTKRVGIKLTRSNTRIEDSSQKKLTW